MANYEVSSAIAMLQIVIYVTVEKYVALPFSTRSECIVGSRPL